MLSKEIMLILKKMRGQLDINNLFSELGVQAQDVLPIGLDDYTRGLSPNDYDCDGQLGRFMLG